MFKILLIMSIFISLIANAHVPTLLLPIDGPPVASYFLTQSAISRAVYSELTTSQSIFVVQFEVKPGEKTLVQVFTPVCPGLPNYEEFQPTALVIKGDLPWKLQGESNRKFIQRLQKNSAAVAESNYPIGKRPRFHEDFANVDYWVGGEWRGQLAPGLYAIVIFSPDKNKGVFSLGVNEKEDWNKDLFQYARSIIPKINSGLCNPRGFTGKLNL